MAIGLGIFADGEEGEVARKRFSSMMRSVDPDWELKAAQAFVAYFRPQILEALLAARTFSPDR